MQVLPDQERSGVVLIRGRIKLGFLLNCTLIYGITSTVCCGQKGAVPKSTTPFLGTYDTLFTFFEKRTHNRCSRSLS
jgi:hypothetical protein